MQANTRGTRGISVPQVGGWRKRERGLGERDGGGDGGKIYLDREGSSNRDSSVRWDGRRETRKLASLARTCKRCSTAAAAALRHGTGRRETRTWVCLGGDDGVV